MHHTTIKMTSHTTRHTCRAARAEPTPHQQQRPALPQDAPPAMLAGHGVVRDHVLVTIAVVRSRLAEPWTLSTLAEEVHLSRSQLVRAFDAALGLSPMAYLRAARVEQMARLLETTDLSIAAVARSVGWTDPNYASRCFRNHAGVPPTEFRRRQPMTYGAGTPATTATARHHPPARPRSGGEPDAWW